VTWSGASPAFVNPYILCSEYLLFLQLFLELLQAPLHAAFDGRVGLTILPGERIRQLHRLRKKALRGMDGRYDLRVQRLFAGQTAAGKEKLPHHCRVGQRQDDLIQERPDRL